MMKKLFMALAAFASLGAASSSFAQTNVGVSIGIHQPGVYGRIDIGNVDPTPVVVYPQPVIIQPTPVAVHQRPIYLYVPEPYQRDWGRYCGRYSACGQPVYFVRETWVRDRWEHDRGRHRGWDKHDRHDHHDHDDHDDDHDHGRGKDHGRGHGHGHGRD